MPRPGSELVAAQHLYLRRFESLGGVGADSEHDFPGDASGLFSGSDRRDDLI